MVSMMCKWESFHNKLPESGRLIVFNNGPDSASIGRLYFEGFEYFKECVECFEDVHIVTFCDDYIASYYDPVTKRSDTTRWTPYDLAYIRCDYGGYADFYLYDCYMDKWSYIPEFKEYLI